jgi:hypothetical protein
MDGDDGDSIGDGIHEGKGQCEKVLLRQRTCDGGAKVFVDHCARQGTYNNGVGIGVGVVEAKSI